MGALFARTERNGDACGAGARRAAYAMNIGFRYIGKVVIDDMTDPAHIDPARSNIGRNQNARLAAAKGGERPFALRLGAIAVNGESLCARCV